METERDCALSKPEYAITVVVPVFNEEDNIQPLANEVFDALAGRMFYELVFVDDGSTDGTLDAIQHAVKQNTAVAMCQHEINRGQSAAVLTGVRAANSKLVAVLDGDGQNDPEDLPRLLEELQSSASVRMVIGQRERRKDSWSRRLSSRVANSIRARILKDAVSDTGCGIKVFYREEFLRLPAFDHMHRFLPALVQRNGGEVRSIPVNHRPRLSGESKYGIGNRLWVGITDMIGVVWLQRRKI